MKRKSSTPDIPSTRRSHQRRRTRQHHSSDEDNEIVIEEDFTNDPDSYHNAKNKQLKRPFEMVSSLPSSTSIPKYNSLTYPLSGKDSGVLYHSLIDSRKTWTHGEMFEWYWSKPPVPDTTSTVRDKMQKLTDCEMQCGPHAIPIRIFILKDDVKEKEWQEMQDKIKKDKEMHKLAEKEEKRKRIEERKKMIQLKKQQREEKAKEVAARKEELKKQKEEQKKQKKKQSSTNSSQNKNNGSSSSQSAADLATSKMIANLNSMAKKDKSLGDLMQKIAGGFASNTEVDEFKKFIEIAKKMPPPPNWKPPVSKTTKNNNTDKTVNNQGTVVSKIPSDKSVKSSPKSITYEMKKIDLINKNKPQISHVDKDKNDDSRQKTTKSLVTSNDKIDDKIEKVKIPLVNSSEVSLSSVDAEGMNVQKTTNDIAIITSSSTRPSKAEILETNNQNPDSILPKGENLESNGTPDTSSIDVKTGSQKEEVSVKKSPKVKILKKNEDKSMQLTAFQQKYTIGAELVIEFRENTGHRFKIPRLSILEHNVESNTYIMSWIVIHNKRDIDRYKAKKVRELCKREHRSEVRKEIEDNYDVYRDEKSPEPLFSAMTARFRGIHLRFKSIFMNSVDDQSHVSSWMESVLKRGIRLSGYNLWYQLDGFDDAQLAENLRVDINEYEQSLSRKRRGQAQ